MKDTLVCDNFFSPSLFGIYTKARLMIKNIHQKDTYYNKFDLRAHNIDTILDRVQQ